MDYYSEKYMRAKNWSLDDKDDCRRRNNNDKVNNRGLDEGSNEAIMRIAIATSRLLFMNRLLLFTIANNSSGFVFIAPMEQIFWRRQQ